MGGSFPSRLKRRTSATGRSRHESAKRRKRESATEFTTETRRYREPEGDKVEASHAGCFGCFAAVPGRPLWLRVSVVNFPVGLSRFRDENTGIAGPARYGA